jgi:16S rRNA (guanine527-N7)-methyltransferase
MRPFLSSCAPALKSIAKMTRCIIFPAAAIDAAFLAAPRATGKVCSFKAGLSMLEFCAMSHERFRTALVAEAARLRIRIPSEKLDALCVHYNLLCAWNRRIRLVGTIEPERAAVELFADSLIACEFAQNLDSAKVAATAQRAFKVIDIGSGAGLPGVPAQIMRPEWNVTLVEADAKRIAFLKKVARELDVNNFQIQRGRAEGLAHDPAHREGFDLAFCRAVAAPAVACELAIPFLAKNGSLILQTTTKENDPSDEKAGQNIRGTAGKLCATINQTMAYTLSTTAGKRMLLQVRKTAATPPEFPRGINRIKKHPLM